MDKLKINEIFIGIQGEGRYTGIVALFIRLSGCNLACRWCDTKYHKNINKEMTPLELADEIEKYEISNIIWTGGEPMLQKDLIRKTMDALLLKPNFFAYTHHIETNGTILDRTFFEDDKIIYIAFSPKGRLELQEILEMNGRLTRKFDIKVVTDGKDVGMKLIEFADILMPLTTDNHKLNVKTRRIVWNLAITWRKRLSLRLHHIVWGCERGK